MNKNILLVLLLGGFGLLLSNCEKEFFGDNCKIVEGAIVQQVVDLSTIHSLDIEVPVELIITEGSTQEIILESTQSIIDAVIEESFVRNEEWNVQLKGCFQNQNEAGGIPVRILATMTALEEIKLAGLGEARTEGVFKNISDLKLEIEGSADFDFKLDSIKNLETKVSGLGEFKLSGFAEKHSIDMSGSGEVKAFDLVSNDCNIKIDGLGACEITVQNSLDVEMQGSGKVCYKGQPTITIDNLGIGEIKDCN